MDLATQIIMLQLQIDDCNTLIEENEWVGPNLSDIAVAHYRMRQDAQEALEDLEDWDVAIRLSIEESDHDLALSLLETDRIHNDEVLRVAEQERSALRDSEIARRAYEMQREQRDCGDVDEHQVVAGLLEELGGNETGLEEAIKNMKLEADTLACSQDDRRGQCCSCMEEMPLLMTLAAPCGDVYCRGCIRQLFQGSMTDEELFPPRCCRQNIPVEQLEHIFDQGFIQAFKERALEMATPNRTYCSHPSCARFIPPGSIIADIATCPRCNIRTCSLCKQASHEGQLCPEDRAFQMLMDVAGENGWQQCHRCRTMVELNHGCNHMTCRCGAQFCYVCAAQWKTCECPQWDEDNLLQEGQRRAARDLHQNAVPQPQAVQAAVEHVRENHGCQHPRGWNHLRREQGHNTRCELCPAPGPRNPLIFINECRVCNLRACWHCIRNRQR
ncbi:hypothetical protein K402DRAFT_388639 [Aulographum hederae CBS 113979]|uniref:RBR-type E3 ubiquitin transferase n=1 Tax=Aulographum hederae CBS 113979 TaxID=1176131 RepID=A0A6G1HFW5_9PEZI|nr:hypothetical protein K402DRAFT_388639 [Aulographum hederae CBS 113979]